MASLTAPSVISLNTTRLRFLLVSLISSDTCQAMASPSRSGSDARRTASAFLAAILSPVIIFSLPGEII